jgi:hypothetical protein
MSDFARNLYRETKKKFEDDLKTYLDKVIPTIHKDVTKAIRSGKTFCKVIVYSYPLEVEKCLQQQGFTVKHVGSGHEHGSDVEETYYEISWPTD